MVSHSNVVIDSHPETEYKPYESKFANILMMEKKNPFDYIVCFRGLFN